jgi:hypothetical protein
LDIDEAQEEPEGYVPPADEVMLVHSCGQAEVALLPGYTPTGQVQHRLQHYCGARCSPASRGTCHTCTSTLAYSVASTALNTKCWLALHEAGALRLHQDFSNIDTCSPVGVHLVLSTAHIRACMLIRRHHHALACCCRTSPA